MIQEFCHSKKGICIFRNMLSYLMNKYVKISFCHSHHVRLYADLEGGTGGPDPREKSQLEDLTVLKRSPDLLNIVKIGQDQLQLIMKHILFYGGCRHFGQVT